MASIKSLKNKKKVGALVVMLQILPHTLASTLTKVAVNQLAVYDQPYVSAE